MDRNERVLVTTLTKKMSEDLTDYLLEMGFRVRYLHSEIDTLERIQIIRELRLGEYDVLVGVNLLREGLDLPEVSLVAILDADKEGFLRGETSLIQTIGRAARNVDGKVLMYADKETDAMRKAIGETDRRRAIQRAYNEEHGITPETIVKGISDITEFLMSDSKVPTKGRRRRADKQIDMTPNEIERMMRDLEEEMLAAAEELRFEYAAKLRDEIRDLRRELDAATAPGATTMYRTSFRSPEDGREALLDALLPLLPSGVREADGRALGDLRRAAGPGGAGGGRRARAGGWSVEEVPADWRHRRGEEGVVIGGRVCIRSPFDPPPADGLVDVVVERRGSAFGSGSHPTTQMCVVAAARARAGRRRRRPRLRRRDAGDRRRQARLGAGRGRGPRAGRDRGRARERGAQRRAGRAARWPTWRSTTCRWRALLLVNAPPPVQERVVASMTDEVRHVIVSGIVADEVPDGRARLSSRSASRSRRRWGRRTSGSRCG